ncbi:hypothetical protein A2V82_16395 [candidate division KSB1 bacterium RBG_16_48_16]|nr:MAG: hypothetical protein A2V82_16395 [candidate division KSB1 bacterium RBG_16_48_16]
MDAVEAIMMSGYRQMGDGGVFPAVKIVYDPTFPGLGTHQCGACYFFPGDGHQCPTTLDTVSRKVGACEKYN